MTYLSLEYKFIFITKFNIQESKLAWTFTKLLHEI